MIDHGSDPGSYADAIRFNPGGQVRLHQVRDPSGASRRDGEEHPPASPSHPVSPLHEGNYIDDSRN